MEHLRFDVYFSTHLIFGLKFLFPLPANCLATEVRKEFRILCVVSPHDKYIVYLLAIVYTDNPEYAMVL